MWQLAAFCVIKARLNGSWVVSTKKYQFKSKLKGTLQATNIANLTNQAENLDCHKKLQAYLGHNNREMLSSRAVKSILLMIWWNSRTKNCGYWQIVHTIYITIWIDKIKRNIKKAWSAGWNVIMYLHNKYGIDFTFIINFQFWCPTLQICSAWLTKISSLKSW